MSREVTFSIEKIAEVQDKVLQALERAIQNGLDPTTFDALQATSALLNSLIGPVTAGPEVPYRGWIDYTFDDDECLPYGRQVDVRIFYGWDDYNPADEPFPIWGARIEEVEMRAVRYYDQGGNVIELSLHHRDLAWDLLAREREMVIQACTDDGCRRSVGTAHPLYTPARAQSPVGASVRRMAPSERLRGPQERRKSM